jgi:HSP20 family protein
MDEMETSTMVDFKALVPWRDKSQTPAPRDEYHDPFLAFRREVDRIFDDFFSGFGRRAVGSPFGPWSTATPSMDLTDNEKEIVVTAEMPGLDEKDFEVTVSGDLLTLKGEKKDENEHRNGDAYYMERRFGSFSRSVRLPFEVKDEKVDARYEKGVLTIRVPKPADLQRQARRIDVHTV